MKTLETIQNELRELITQGIDLTIASLKTILKSGTDCHNNLILLEGRYQDVSRQLLQGIISNEDATLAFNVIRKELLDFVNCLKETDVQGLAAAAENGGLADVYNGEVIYRIPKKMQLGMESECIVRLAFDRKTILHDFEIQVGDVMRDLRISDVMGVELLDPAADKTFSITTLNDTVQFVEKDLVTEWIFCVTPLRAGEFPLVLKISIIEIINGIERKRNEVLKEQVQIVTEKPADALQEFVSAGYSWQVTDSDEQRAVPGAGAKSIEPPSVSPSPAAPSPAPAPQPSNAAKAVGLGLIGKVIAGVAVLVIGGIALKPFLFNNNSDVNIVASDDSPAGKMRRLRSNANRQELESFLRENPGTPEASTAMMVLDSLENDAWNSAVAMNDEAAMADYLANYPSGKYSDKAAYRIDELNRGEVVAIEEAPADTIVQVPIEKIPEDKPKITKPVPPKKKPQTNITPKPKQNQVVKPVQKPTAPTKPEIPKPAPVDPNAPVALVSAARRPVFKKCDSSNKEKEQKCTTDKIYQFLRNRVEYPKEAMDRGIQGTVIVSFVVERNGTITDVKTLNDIGGGCGKEAVRLIKSLPKFKPGLNVKGEPIRVQYTQPVTFKLN